MSAGKHQAYGILECRGAGAGGIILYVALSKVRVVLPPLAGEVPHSGLVQRGGKRFLRLTGLSPRGFSGLTGPLGPRVVVGALLGASTMLPPTGGIYTHRPKGDTLTLSR